VKRLHLTTVQDRAKTRGESRVGIHNQESAVIRRIERMVEEGRRCLALRAVGGNQQIARGARSNGETLETTRG